MRKFLLVELEGDDEGLLDEALSEAEALMDGLDKDDEIELTATKLDDEGLKKVASALDKVE